MTTNKDICNLLENNKIPNEFYDMLDVYRFGVSKYKDNEELQNKKFSHEENHASMSRHLAEAYVNIDKDKDSGLDPLLHLASRALLEYTLKKRQRNEVKTESRLERIFKFYDKNIA